MMLNRIDRNFKCKATKLNFEKWKIIALFREKEKQRKKK